MTSRPPTPSLRPSLTADSPLVAAAHGRPPTRTPVWFMRQAGRSLPEYRQARRGIGMLDSCLRPELVTELTLQPVRRYGVDAAILFSDIVVPLRAAGVGVDIVAGTGPVLAEPVRTTAAVDDLVGRAVPEVPEVAEAVRMLVAELGDTPLIGFAGAPFTLACYLIEGGPSRDHARAKAFMYGRPDDWHRLMDWLADLTLASLRAQVGAGASAVQLFDSWAGSLSLADYERHVLAHSSRILAGLADAGVPRIHFGVGTGELLDAMGRAGADVVGVDWRVPLDVAAGRVGPGRAVQGNLDPATLLADWSVVERETLRVVEQGRAADGHIVNLGHGVLPSTDPDVLHRVVDLVHSLAP